MATIQTVKLVLSIPDPDHEDQTVRLNFYNVTTDPRTPIRRLGFIEVRLEGVGALIAGREVFGSCWLGERS